MFSLVNLIIAVVASLMISYGANYYIPKNGLQAAGWIVGGFVLLAILKAISSGTLSTSVLIPDVPSFWGYAVIALVISFTYLPTREYVNFYRRRVQAAKLKDEIEQFQFECKQRSPVDTDTTLHQRNLVEHQKWVETEFRKRFTKSIRRSFSNILQAESTIPFRIELEANKFILELARQSVSRDVFAAYLTTIVHSRFVFPDWESTVRSSRQILVGLLVVWAIIALATK